MNPYAHRLSLFFARLPERLQFRKGAVWITLLLITLVLAAGLPRVRTDGSVLSYFNESDPMRQAYDQYRAAFGGDEILYLVYEARDGDVFSDASLEALAGIQDELINYRLDLAPGATSPLDHIEDVTTLINVSYLEARGDALVSRDFIGSSLPADDTARERLRRAAFRESYIPRVFVSEDSRFGGIVIDTDFNARRLTTEDGGAEAGAADDIYDDIIDREASDKHAGMGLADSGAVEFQENVMADYVPFMKAVKAIIQKPAYAGALTFYPVGAPAFMEFVLELVLGEMGMIILGMLALIVITTGVLFRSLSAMVWTVLAVVISLVWTMGSVGWSGVVMPDLVIMVVFFVVAVCVADAIHILSGYLFFRQQDKSHAEALRCVYRKSGLACLLTSVTTAVGFASMIFVPIATMQRIGGATAVGIVYAFCITLFVLPLMLDAWRPESGSSKSKGVDIPAKPHALQRLLRRFELLGYRHANAVMLVFLALAVGLSLGISLIRVESSNIKILRSDLPIRQAFDLADDRMGGTDNLEILVDTGRIDGIKDPGVLNMMAHLQHLIEKEFSDTVTNTFSIADVAKDAFQALNNDDPAAYRIPQDPGVLGQALFLYDNADPEDRREIVTDDYRIGRISVSSKSLDTRVGLRLLDAVDRFSAENLPLLRNTYPAATITMTGMAAMNMKMYHFISRSQLISFGITLVVISVVLLLALGSVRLGLLALIPNLFPIVTAAGLMGFCGIPLDLHTLLVIPIVIGIAVDDTIHFLTHFQIERREHGDTRTAVVLAFREAGQAILFTSIVLSISFLMYLGSKNMGFVYFGFLSAIAIAVAVVTDLILLPAILAKHFPDESAAPASRPALSAKATTA